MHQVVQDSLNVVGLMLPGAPFIVAGHNQNIAWGLTNTYTDNVDFYQEKINETDSNLYLLNDQWLPLAYEKTTIYIKGGDSVRATNKFTHRGRVINQFKKLKGNTIITMHWCGDEYSNEYRGVMKINEAKNLNEFKEGLAEFKAISQNFAYADVNGNIALVAASGVPVRKRDISFGLLPGWTNQYDWQHYLPFEKLPNMANPDKQYVSSANNRTADSTYPYHIGSWYALPYRFNRINQLIEETNMHTVESFKAMQTDSKSLMASEFQTLIINELKKPKRV
ncbi:MAG: penicillin acylase family protein [Bacteroidales bacterium]|nr:penicillin acylase family protein [Bacteroidales bacterium]